MFDEFASVFHIYSYSAVPLLLKHKFVLLITFPLKILNLHTFL